MVAEDKRARIRSVSSQDQSNIKCLGACPCLQTLGSCSQDLSCGVS